MHPRYHLPRGGTQAASGLWMQRIVIEISVMTFALWAATEYVAWRFRWHPNLGVPLWSTPWGNLYEPWAWLRWAWHYHALPGTQAWWHHALGIVSIAHLGPLCAVALAVRRDRAFGGKSDLHGSARWATWWNVKRSGLLKQGDGVYVGGWQEGKKLYYLRHNGPEHVLAFAPTRSGKDIGLVTPTLLTYPHSVIINDIKGESWALTAGWRQKELGSTVLRFDPTCQDGSAARYNPLLEVRPWPLDVRDAQNIVEILTHPSTAEYSGDDHWRLAAQDLLVGTILHQLYVGTEKTFAGCLELLTDPRRDVNDTLQLMMTTEHRPGWVHPVVAGSIRAVLNKADRERAGVISTAIKFLNLYRDPIVAQNTSACDFSLRDLLYGETTISVYLTWPPSDLARLRPLVRLLIAQLGQRLTEEQQGAVDNYRAGKRMLFMVNEFASLKRLDFFATSLGWLASYGIQCCFVLQDLTQLEAEYGPKSSIMAGCHVRVAFTPNTKDTAQTLSEMLGPQTVHKEIRTYTGNRLSPWLGHVIASEQESQRPLLTTDELLTMPDTDALIFVGGQRPLYGSKIRYYEDAEFLRRSQIPAPVQSDRIPLVNHPWTQVGSNAVVLQPWEAELKEKGLL